MLIRVREYANKHGKTPTLVYRMIKLGKLKTATKIGCRWMIDSDEPYPDDRIRHGDYIGWRDKLERHRQERN